MTGPTRVEGLTLSFVNGDPTDDVVNAIHSSIKRANLKPPMTLRVRWEHPGVSVKSLRLVLSDGEEICATEPALFPALHRLCAHAASFEAASQEDRIRWRKAMESTQTSGVYTAVK